MSFIDFMVFRPQPFAFEKNMYFGPDPVTGYSMLPGSTGFYYQIPAVVNSHGHRNRETTLQKTRKCYRIMVLGDSFTVGENVRRPEAYPQVLETMLNKQLQ